MEPRELCYLPATQLAAAIRTKELSAVEICDAILYRIRQLNPKLNAYCTVTAEAARTAAREAEAAVMRGEFLGPLHGVPFSLKDLTPTQGIRTTFGSKILSTTSLTKMPSWSSVCEPPGACYSAKPIRRSLVAKDSRTTRFSVRLIIRGISNARRAAQVAVPGLQLPPAHGALG